MQPMAQAMSTSGRKSPAPLWFPDSQTLPARTSGPNARRDPQNMPLQGLAERLEAKENINK